ncbi:MAG: hypothetical protein EOS41_27075 [Mesorhizobium sp.]|nr:MAG: hypothetical protein EOS41_27075 [Mesorhizobium sp.]TGT57536.1 hypothetical protein EN813_036450 [Mesorhizobium sp. M00.F.Ca.ET.170.01.1.1]
MVIQPANCGISYLAVILSADDTVTARAFDTAEEAAAFNRQMARSQFPEAGRLQHCASVPRRAAPGASQPGVDLSVCSCWNGIVACRAPEKTSLGRIEPQRWQRTLRQSLSSCGSSPAVDRRRQSRGLSVLSLFVPRCADARGDLYDHAQIA